MMIDIGYFNRPLSWYIYLSLVVILFGLHLLMMRIKMKIDATSIAIGVGVLLVFSYPLLSHDFFNYMFDAKILTYYGDNPYTMRALDYPEDQWLRFMHWVHRPYPYGPIFLLVSIPAAFFGFGTFLIHFLLLKATFVGFYILAVYFLQKMNKTAALFFATNPFVLIEGLVSGHNEIVAVSLGIIGIYLLFQNKSLWSRVFFVLSIGIKYMTLPILLLGNKDKPLRNVMVLAGLLIVISYVVWTKGLQQWYFLNIIVLIATFPMFVQRLNIFFFGLLMSYYPYIFLGGWDKVEKVVLKNNIAIIFLVINCLLLAYWYRTEIRSYFSQGVALFSRGRTSSQT